MNYCETKVHLIDQIEENCKKLNNDQLCEILRKTEECKPKILHEFIKEMFEAQFNGNTEVLDTWEEEFRMNDPDEP